MATTKSVTDDEVMKDAYHNDNEEGEEGESAAPVRDQQSQTTLTLLQYSSLWMQLEIFS